MISVLSVITMLVACIHNKQKMRSLRREFNMIKKEKEIDEDEEE